MLVVELLQILVPFISRSFDVDDIILNTIGSIIGTYLAIYIKKQYQEDPKRMRTCIWIS
ncbi:VanZ family protein [Bacillus cereus]|uniref:VanZ family protein n=1 Tax=Bacillus cereus TaxID=1396 RepID=UPI0020D27D63|nr:VanZ family protein [Bacillus cereus]